LVTLAEHPLVTIGAHTRDHRMLPKLDDVGVLADLDAGTRALDELLGPGERVLAYPHGRTDRRVEGLVRRAGFRHALTTAGRPVSRFDAARRLPRVNPADLTGERFAEWLDAPT
jgi:peptidoglycan/xylan/chitin deacetylase (PgdA/CDA1 family)